jgi:hypothetical protein
MLPSNPQQENIFGNNELDRRNFKFSHAYQVPLIG